MSALISLVLIALTAVGICILFQLEIEESLPITCMSMTALGYIITLFGGAFLLGSIPWIGGISGVALILGKYKFKYKIQWQRLSQGLVLFFIFALLYWWLCRGCQFTDWDDFSHWGKATKWLYSTGTLSTAAGSTDNFASYPPATSVWAVMLMQASRSGFREDIALYANALLTTCWLVLPFRAIRFKKSALSGILMVFILSLAPILVYNSYFYRASVDGLLGIFLAGLLLAIFLPRFSSGSIYLICIGCFVLSLVKTTGAGLAIVIAAIFIATRVPKVRFPHLSYIFVSSPLVATIIAQLSWNLHKLGQGVEDRWISQSPITGIYQLLTGNSASYRLAVLREFSQIIFVKPNYGLLKAPFIVWPIIFFILSLLSIAFVKSLSLKRCFRQLTVSTLLVSSIFIFGLLYSYLFVFDPSEATTLSSVYRYLDTITLMLLVVGMSELCIAVSNYSFVIQIIPTVYIAFSICLFPFISCLQQIYWSPTHAAQTQQSRYLASHAADRIRALGEKNPRLWLITANDAGIAALKIEYELLPQHLPPQSNILMETVPEGNPWARQISKETFSKELADGFDYLYIYCPEDQFVRDYLSVFESSSQSEVIVDRMFAVIRQPDGTALLRCIDS